MTDAFLSADFQAWMGPYYADLAQRWEFALLSPSHRFDQLVAAVAPHHPRDAAVLRGSNTATQEAILHALAEAARQRPAAHEVEQWRVRKGPRELRCVIVGLPTGMEVQLFEGLHFRRTELARHGQSGKAKALEWKQRPCGSLATV